MRWRLARCGLASVALLLTFSTRRLGAGDAPAPDGIVRMVVSEIVHDPKLNVAIVALTTVRKDLVVPIIVGMAEGSAIAQRVQKLPPPPRPMTHDLLKRVMGRLGGRLDRAVVTRLHRDVFYAELVVRRGAELLRIDCRPSDAIALALRAGAPIYCNQAVLDQAGVKPNEPPPARKPARPKKFI